MTHVLTALGNRWDSRVATLLEGSREVTIVRRCADLPDLVATAAAGLGTVALVSSDLRGLDLTVVAQLRSAGVHVVGIAPDGDEDSERRLRQLGVGRLGRLRVRAVTVAGGRRRDARRRGRRRRGSR